MKCYTIRPFNAPLALQYSYLAEMTQKTIDRRFCIAPMLDWTDTHCRGFHRLLTRQAVLYTEMVTTGALIYGDVERHLRFGPTEHPVALQLGGSDPADLARCSKLAQDYGYDEVNLNVGCPSDRVQSGRFGACLMAEPGLVAECTAAMRRAKHVSLRLMTSGVSLLSSEAHILVSQRWTPREVAIMHRGVRYSCATPHGFHGGQ